MKIIVADRATVERGLAVKSRYAVISIIDAAAPEARIPRTTAQLFPPVPHASRSKEVLQLRPRRDRS